MRAAVATSIVTVVLAVVALAWNPVVAARLVELPADFDTRVTASGTFEAHAAPGSLARLPAPATLPVEIDLQVATVAADGNLAIVGTTQTQKVGAAGGPTQDVTLKSQYVLDRHTTKNVDDPRAWSFQPTHPVNRAGSYSFTFGFDFSPTGTYPLWDDSISAGYPLTRADNAVAADTGGLTTTAIAGSTTHAAEPAWLAALTPLQLPTTLTPAQWTAAGFTVDASASSVKVDYLVTLRTQVAVDDETGETANLVQEVVTLAARPDPAATGGVAADPQTVFVTTVAETAASVATDTAQIHQADDELALVERTIPRVIGALAIAFAVLSVVLVVRARRRAAGPA